MDTECIEDNGDYIRIVERLFSMSKDTLNVENINDYIDFDQKVAFVSFDFLGKNYKLDLSVDDDWLDTDIFNKLNNVLYGLKIKKRFYVHVVDQGILVGFFAKSQVFELNKLSVNRLEFF